MSEMSGPKFMKREEFKAYATQLREKSTRYKRMKTELAEIRNETVVLSRTEAILRSRDEHLDELLARIESERGVRGYTDTASKLSAASEQTAAVDTTKGRTLEEISRIVTEINTTLREKKNLLAPQIKELRAVRQRYQEVEGAYLADKGKYDSLAAGFDAERARLESDCSACQDDCLKEESRYHYLNCMVEILRPQLERVKQEQSFEAGEGRLLRDFKTWKELYSTKVRARRATRCVCVCVCVYVCVRVCVWGGGRGSRTRPTLRQITQQDQLSKELRRRHKEVKESAGANMGQRQLFVVRATGRRARPAMRRDACGVAVRGAGPEKTDGLEAEVNARGRIVRRRWRGRRRQQRHRRRNRGRGTHARARSARGRAC